MINLLRKGQRIERFNFQSLAAKLLQNILTNRGHRAGVGMTPLGGACPYTNITVAVAPGLMLEIVTAFTALDYAGKAGGSFFAQRLMWIMKPWRSYLPARKPWMP